MLEPSYTLSDQPDVVARIEHDLDRIRATVVGGDPRLRSLVLTGGFARGEGAMRAGRPQNDYDLIAVRSLGPSKVPYGQMRSRLEKELGLHIDLAQVAAWRLRFAPASIFWYETALRNRLLWGEDLMGRVPRRDVVQLDRAEGLRLLSNRAAGLLLATGQEDAHELRLQAAKGLLATSDVHLIAQGRFPPSQTERRMHWTQLRQEGALTDAMREIDAWVEWAYWQKVTPDDAPPKDPHTAWKAAADALLKALPVAMDHAGVRSLEEYRNRDTWVDRLYYATRSRKIPKARSFMWRPTGEVRVATWRLLDEARDGVVRPQAAQRILGPLNTADESPLTCLERLRGATLQ